MADTPVILSVFFEAVAGREQDLAEQLALMVEPTRKEEGCVDYQLHVDPTDTKKLFFYEHFKNEDAFQSHLVQPYCKAFGAYRENGSGDPVASVTVTKWSKL